MFGSKNWSKLSPSLKLPEEVGITRLLRPVRIDFFLSTYFVHLLFQIETRSASFSCTSKRHYFEFSSCVHINQSIHLWTLNFFTLELKICGLGFFLEQNFVCHVTITPGFWHLFFTLIHVAHPGIHDLTIIVNINYIHSISNIYRPALNLMSISTISYT